MAKSHSKWYSSTAAKRLTVQPMKDCKISGTGAVWTPETAMMSPPTVGGMTVYLRREVESGPNIGYDESFSVQFTGEEIESLYQRWQALKKDYPARS